MLPQTLVAQQQTDDPQQDRKAIGIMLRKCLRVSSMCLREVEQRGVHASLSFQVEQLGQVADRMVRGVASQAATSSEAPPTPSGAPPAAASTASRDQGGASAPQPQSGRVRMSDPQLKPPSLVGSARQPIDLRDAIQEVKNGRECKFDQTMEVCLRLGTDPRRGDQQVRGSVVLPHGTGKAVRICVFAEGEAAEMARTAGADVIGDDALIAGVADGNLPFDKCLATADMMPRLSKVARVLGPRGMMPNPKLGTLVDAAALPKAIKQMKGGRVEYRADKTANLQAGIGKKSFSAEDLYGNLGAFGNAILNARPKGVKGSGATGYILSAHLTSTMGRGVPFTVSSLVTAVQKSKR